MASQEASDVSPSSPPSGSATASQAPPSAKFTWTWWDEVIAPKAGVGGGSKPWRCRRCAYERNASVQKVRAHFLHLKGHAVQFCPKTVSAEERQKLINLEKTLEDMKEAKKSRNKRHTVDPKDMAAASLIRTSSSPSASFCASTGTATTADHRPPHPPIKPSSSSFPYPRPSKRQATLGESWKPALKEEVDVAVARFFYHDHIAFNAARSPYFKEMAKKIGEYGPDYVPPSSETLRTTLLEKEKMIVDAACASTKASWKKNGVSLIVDGWSDTRQEDTISDEEIDTGAQLEDDPILQHEDYTEEVVEIKQSDTGEVGCFAVRPFQAGEYAVKIPENFTVTCADVANHPVLSQLAAGRPDIIGLALWLMYEKSLGAKSLWYPYLKTFPSTTLSPVTWSQSEQETLLKGTSVAVILGYVPSKCYLTEGVSVHLCARRWRTCGGYGFGGMPLVRNCVGLRKVEMAFTAEEVNQRCLFLEDEFSEIMEASQSKLMDLPQSYFTVDAFKNAFAVVLSRAIYLPSAELYALVWGCFGALNPSRFKGQLAQVQAYSMSIGSNLKCRAVSQAMLNKDVVLGIALVDMDAKCGALQAAQRVLDELPFRNVVSWST
ncbi:hypothetical protein L7F22_002806 [Adiantum nelumboides]|nr:hypothetical protein [Adiantum nelumboides]